MGLRVPSSSASSSEAWSRAQLRTGWNTSLGAETRNGEGGGAHRETAGFEEGNSVGARDCQLGFEDVACSGGIDDVDSRRGGGIENDPGLMASASRSGGG